MFFHGFASSANSGNAIEMRNSLYEEDVEVKTIDIPVMPLEAMLRLKEWVKQEKPDLIVGTSMGAMYAEQMKGVKRILVNPSFDMARTLTFGGMGRREFRNKREDGTKDFKVDKEMIAQFRTVQKDSLKGITAEEKELVWGLFGRLDKVVNYQKEFQKAYGKQHFIIFEGEHYLNGKVLSHTVLPLVRDLLSD